MHLFVIYTSNIITAKKLAHPPASRSTLMSYHKCCQRNRRWLLTTGFDRCTLFTTADNTCCVTTVELCWQICGPMSYRTAGHINTWTYLFMLYQTTRRGVLGGFECSNRISSANFLIVRVTTLQTMWNSPTVRGTPSWHSAKCYSYHACTSVTVSGGGRNAMSEHDPKLYL